MRLIDADKIDYIMGEKPSSLDYVRRAHIADEPTVKAIPIEWIRKYTNHRTVEFGDMWVFINCMINDWEKENERMDNR